MRAPAGHPPTSTISPMSSHDFDVPFEVPLVHRLRFTDDVLGEDWPVLADLLSGVEGRSARVLYWLDDQVHSANPGIRERLKELTDATPGLERAGSVQVVPGGEPIKNNIHILERMLKVFEAAHLDRRSYVVVIGGGAVLDAVGFAAAIAHRGLRLVRLPTTTLSQGDSGVGVKNGVNLFHKKNWLGAFAAPWGVVNDAALLSSLGDRDFISGFSESVKVSLLKDPVLFERICQDATRIRLRRMDCCAPVIRESALLHLDHIARRGDPFEMNEARPLDYGHWSAHKLESMTEFTMRHGEAVAIGVAIDTVYSSLRIGLPAEDAERVLDCLSRLGFDLGHPALEERETLFEGLEEFRQHLGGRLTLTMLHAVGRPVEIHEVDDAAMRESIDRVMAFALDARRPRRAAPADSTPWSPASPP